MNESSSAPIPDKAGLTETIDDIIIELAERGQAHANRGRSSMPISLNEIGPLLESHERLRLNAAEKDAEIARQLNEINRMQQSVNAAVTAQGMLEDQRDAAHAAGVAEGVAKVKAADERIVEALAGTLVNEGGGVGSSIHSWRCEYPDRYGACDCVEATAKELAAVVEPIVRERAAEAWDEGRNSGAADASQVIGWGVQGAPESERPTFPTNPYRESRP